MILLTLTQVAACSYVLYVCIMVLNKMDKYTRHVWRGSYLALSFASAAGIIYEPNVPTCMYAVGVAVYLACNERKHYAPEHKSVS